MPLLATASSHDCYYGGWVCDIVDTIPLWSLIAASVAMLWLWRHTISHFQAPIINNDSQSAIIGFKTHDQLADF